MRPLRMLCIRRSHAGEGSRDPRKQALNRSEGVFLQTRWAGQMKNTILNNGDLVLLFSNLPFDYEADLPLSPTVGVTVASTPHSLLDTPDADHLPCYVLPGTKLPGMDINNCCLVSRESESVPPNVTRESLLFSYLASLRLLAPAPISVAGHFVYGGDAEPISHPTLFNMQSMWQPDANYRYSGAEFLRGGRLLDRMNGYLTAGPARLKYALMMFTQVTGGFSLSYQMCVLGLYATLEALFAPSGGRNYAKTLGARLGAYLSSYDKGMGICDWIEKHYQAERHSLSHGFWQFSPDSGHFDERKKDFGKVHEIVRLSLLGFLSMDPKETAFFNLTGKKLQRALDDLMPASGEFIQGQTMWLS
jgi:hypothetical protein